MILFTASETLTLFVTSQRKNIINYFSIILQLPTTCSPILVPIYEKALYNNKNGVPKL
jgi:hypothetical protein